MPNQYKNKVIYNGNTLIDISDTTAVVSDVLAGKDFYLADGSKGTGTKAVYTVTGSIDEHVQSQNGSSQVLGGQSYYTVLDPNDSYWLSSVTVTMGGVDITSQVFTGIEKQFDGYSVTTDLTHCYISNEIVNKTSFRVDLVPEPSYVNPQVTIEMGGIDVSELYSSGVINIPNVTGNIVITAFASRAVVTSISATYTQSGTVYDADTLDSLKSDLVVTATYADSSTETVADYTLSGTLARGTTSTITVSYGGKTTTFNVVVSPYYRFVYSYQDGILSAQDYMTFDETSSMPVSDAETLTSTGVRFYAAKTSSASNNKGTRLIFVPDYFTSYAKLTFRAKVVSVGWYQSSNVSSIGPIYFAIGNGEENGALGFCKSGSSSSPTYLKYFNSSGSVVWGNEVSDTDFHTFVIEIQNNKISISMDDVIQVSDIDAHTSTSKNMFSFSSSNSGADDIYITDIEYIGD